MMGSVALFVAALLVLVLTGLGLVVSAGMKRWTLEVVDAELSRRALALAESIHQEHGHQIGRAHV